LQLAVFFSLVGTNTEKAFTVGISCVFRVPIENIYSTNTKRAFGKAQKI